MTHLMAAAILAPSVDYWMLAPVLVVLGGAVVGVLIEAFFSREWRRPLQLSTTFVSIVMALMVLLSNHQQKRVGYGAVFALANDGFGLLIQGIILCAALIGAMYFAENRVDPQGDAFAPQASALPGSEDEIEFTGRGWLQTEIWPLFLFSVGGMLIFPIANDLLTLFVALEVMSLPLYLMAGMARRRRLLSQEAALKYFVLGAFASAFMLYGSALVYGFTGSVNFNDIANALMGTAARGGLLLVGVLFIVIGLLFKVGAAPFHQWTPDVYQGAPTAVTGFMAAATKVAAFGALIRISITAFGGMSWDIAPALWLVAGVTMLVGTVIGVAQTDIKRMLAYSSIAHAGFLLMAVIAGTHAAASGALFYLAAYSLTTLGTFGVVSLVRDATGEATALGAWAGLGKRSPLLAGVFTLFLLALAGIPLTSGFTSKFAVFAAAYEAGQQPLVVLAVVASAIAAFFYLRVIVLMYLTEPVGDEVSVVIPSFYSKAALALCAAGTVALGVFPQPLLDLVTQIFLLK